MVGRLLRVHRLQPRHAAFTDVGHHLLIERVHRCVVLERAVPQGHEQPMRLRLLRARELHRQQVLPLRTGERFAEDRHILLVLRVRHPVQGLGKGRDDLPVAGHIAAADYRRVAVLRVQPPLQFSQITLIHRCEYSFALIDMS